MYIYIYICAKAKKEGQENRAARIRPRRPRWRTAGRPAGAKKNTRAAGEEEEKEEEKEVGESGGAGAAGNATINITYRRVPPPGHLLSFIARRWRRRGRVGGGGRMGGWRGGPKGWPLTVYAYEEERRGKAQVFCNKVISSRLSYG